MRTIFYKDWKWYFKLSILIPSVITLSYGFYLCCFKEFWYVEKSVIERYVSFFNAEALMSFYSVQVTLITTGYLFLLVVYHNKENNGFFFGYRFKSIITVWNLIMLLIFWIAIFSSMNINGGFSEYTKNQLALSLVSHLLCPMLFVAYVIISCGYEKSYYLRISLNDIIVTFSYPVIYFIYIKIRAALIIADPNREWIYAYWYDFLNFSAPNIGFTTNPVLYGFLFIILFGSLYTSFWLLMTYINNVRYSFISRKDTEKREQANEMVRE